MNDAETARAEAFYEGALGRIQRIMLVLGPALALGALLVFPWRVAAGFLVGSAVSYMNFVWLKRAVIGLLDRVAGGGAPQSGWSIVLRLLARYAVIGVLAYVIFIRSDASLYGFLAGLFLPVAAMMCEAACEGWMALRRGL